MATLRLRLHPGLIPDDRATWRQRYKTPHFAQGSRSFGCGQAVVMSALAILGLEMGAELEALRSGHHEACEAEEGRFGTSHHDMLGLVNGLRHPLRYAAATGSMRFVRTFAVEHLRTDELVMLEIKRWERRLGHWILAVGLQETEVNGCLSASALLCLDPAELPLTVAPWNGLLDLGSPFRGARHIHYRTADSIQNVAFHTAIALTLPD
jgi:hypothetical protein